MNGNRIPSTLLMSATDFVGNLDETAEITKDS